MRYIKKRTQEPKELTAFKNQLTKAVIYEDTYSALYNDQITFKALQQTLAKEQGYLCAYCLGELEVIDHSTGSPTIKMKVEHFKPKSIFNGQINTAHQAGKLCDKKQLKRTDLRIDYHNLFAVCLGRSRELNGETHCDTPPNGKDDQELCFIPNPSKGKARKFDLKIRYTRNFSITSDHGNINTELTAILNLNEQSLKNRRQSTWKGVARKIAKEVGIETWEQATNIDLSILQNILEQYKNPKKDGTYYEFCECIIYQLEKRLRMLSKKMR